MGKIEKDIYWKVNLYLTHLWSLEQQLARHA